MCFATRLSRFVWLFAAASLAIQSHTGVADTRYWFAPLPPMPERDGRRYTGSDDFMALFSPEAPWQTVASQIGVFKLYGEWVLGTTDAMLRQVIVELRRRGIALAIEGGPLEPRGCGGGLEGFARSQWVKIANRIAVAGGTIDYIDMDEPYYFAHFFEGAQACRWATETVTQQLAGFIKEIHEQFPQAVIGDVEPLIGPADAATYRRWIDRFQELTGGKLGHLHIDVDWRRPNWPQEVRSIEEYGRHVGVPVGLIYSGNHGDRSDATWLANAGERVRLYELGSVAGRPEHVLFQSWHDKPDRLLPDTAEFSFTRFIHDYFTDKERLGYSLRPGINLAHRKPVFASATYETNTAEEAVDGDTATAWNSGGFAPQWLQIELGGSFTLGGIRLIASQTPSGLTTHEIYGRVAGDAWQRLYRFDGQTSDGQTLEAEWTHPIVGIDAIRVVTTNSPSWIGWREIEVINAGSAL